MRPQQRERERAAKRGVRFSDWHTFPRCYSFDSGKVFVPATALCASADAISRAAGLRLESIRTQSKQRLLGIRSPCCNAEGRMKGVLTPQCSGTCCSKLFYLPERFPGLEKTAVEKLGGSFYVCPPPPNFIQSQRMKVIDKLSTTSCSQQLVLSPGQHQRAHRSEDGECQSYSH